jgi:putative hemolysin
MISEILPKILAFRMPLSFASFLVFPMTLAHFLLTPLRILFQGLASQILQWFGIKVSGPTALTEQDFLTLVEVGAESGTLDRDEKEMIFSVFHFGDLTVSSVMTPWEKVQWIKETETPQEILELARKTRLSRFPVISSKGSEVVGILHTKELLPFLENKDSIQSIKSIMFDPYIVSIHKKVSHLFREFKIKKIHMALIVDEFGRHRGVVTLEDLLNTLFRTQQKKGDTP